MSGDIDDRVRLERRGAVAVVRMCRPARHNALDLRLVAELGAALDHVARAEWCRAVVLTGDAPSFCSGMDLGAEMMVQGSGRVQHFYGLLRQANTLLFRLRDLPQPVVAAVQGYAIGIGFALAAAADLRVVTPTTCFRASFVRIGMTPGDLGLTWLLPRLIGPEAASRLLLTGDDLAGSAAVSLGFASELADDPTEAAFRIATTIAEQAPMAVRLTKELLNLSLGMSGLREQVEVEVRSQALCALTDDHHEARTAFEEGRPPQFTGA